MHGFAGAIDAALGVDKRIKSGRHRPSGDAAVGQVEGRRFQAEEGIVGLGGGDDAAGAWPPSPRVRPASNCT